MPVKNAGAQHRSASENTKCHEMVFGPDASAVVFDHGRRARPNGVDEGFGLVAVGRELFGEELKVSGRERLLIHRQQHPVQVE